jgi:hypothetical protein
MRTRRQTLIFFICAAMVFASCVVAFAQSAAQEKAAKAAQEKAQIEVIRGEALPTTARPSVGFAMAGGENTFTFVASEMSFGGKVVKGAPYSAQAVTENIQTLQDGNRIVNKTTQDIYRDSEGRTRHEQTLGGFGTFVAKGEPSQTIFINDPVDNITYILDPRDKSARKIQVFVRTDGKSGDGETYTYSRSEGGNVWVESGVRAKVEAGEKMKVQAKEKTKEDGVVNFTVSDDGRNFRVNQVKHESKNEELGKQMVEGVEAEGTRSTFTIPAGEIGNERPINVVTETWYSPELQTVVMRRHTDPRLGETTYRLTNISRSEPSRSLFEMPSDYTLKEETFSGPMKMKIEQERMRKPKQNEQ